jgi:hypothetical protein
MPLVLVGHVGRARCGKAAIAPGTEGGRDLPACEMPPPAPAWGGHTGDGVRFPLDAKALSGVEGWPAADRTNSWPARTIRATADPFGGSGVNASCEKMRHVDDQVLRGSS